MPSALAMTPLSYAQVRDTLQSDVGIPSDEYDTDTGPIIGERGNRPYLSINILDLFIDLRLRVGQLIFCIGTAVILLVITSVLILLLLIGFGRVLRDISTQEENIKQGLQMIPNMPSRNHKIVYTTTGGKQDIDQYVEEIDNYLKNYLNEQGSRWKYTKDCAPDEKPVDHWCSFPMTRFEREGRGCTSLNRYGYDNYQPCILFALTDESGWKPQTKSNVTELTMKCKMYDRLSMMKTGNITYYAAFSRNAEYGALPMNKIPSRKIVDMHGRVIMDELGEILYDLPGLLFVKLLPTPNLQYTTVTCYLTTVLGESEIYNIKELKGNKEFKFDIIFNVKQ